jgi:hypothetical protein
MPNPNCARRVRRVRPRQREKRDVLVYFDNTVREQSTRDAGRRAELIELKVTWQRAA